MFLRKNILVFPNFLRKFDTRDSSLCFCYLDLNCQNIGTRVIYNTKGGFKILKFLGLIPSFHLLNGPSSSSLCHSWIISLHGWSGNDVIDIFNFTLTCFLQPHRQGRSCGKNTEIHSPLINERLPSKKCEKAQFCPKQK